MLLCDVGNTSFHFYDSDKIYTHSAETFDPSQILEEVNFICVNPHVIGLLNGLENWTNLADSIDISKYYETMGIDRIMACEAIENGVIVDAGSAITIDIVRDGVFEGGFIYPGVKAMSETYSKISSRLDYNFNFEIDFTKLPKNSQDSITYGYLKPFYSEVVSYGMDIYLTGGDAEKLSSIFPSAKLDHALIFKGMKKVLSRAHKTLSKI